MRGFLSIIIPQYPQTPLKTIHPDVRKLVCTADLLPHSLPPTVQQYVELARTPDRYPRINEGPTDGRIIIFNCVETRGQLRRQGSLHNVKRLRWLAHRLGFRSWLYRDFELDRFKQTLARAFRRPFPAVGGVFWLVIMGHGNQDGIMCADGDQGFITYAEIRHLLSTAPALYGIPKIETIVSCRHRPTSTPVAQLSAVIQRTHSDYSEPDDEPDDELDKELDKEISSESPPTGQTQCPFHQLPDPSDGVRINMPEEGSDILLAMSTIEGFASLGTSVAGSPFIFHLCNVFSTRAAQDDAHVMLARVNNLVSRAAYGERHERMQPVFSSTLGGPLYLARAASTSDSLMQTEPL